MVEAPNGDELGERDVICDGFFMSVVTADVIVGKMAGRELHPWVVLMACCVVIPHLHFAIMVMVSFYHISVFADLSFYLNLPLLAVCKNVYCDGVFDLCHVGHKNLFRAALKFGNRLFVGVMGDEDCKQYKRQPIMTHAERG